MSLNVKITVHYEKALELALLGWDTGKQVSYHGVPYHISYKDTESKYNEDMTCRWTSVTYTLNPVTNDEADR
jgi:hypothetical protein